MTTPKDVHYHSFEVQEIVERVPKWTSRWGMSALFITLSVILITCSLVKLPLNKQFPVLLKIDEIPFYLLNNPEYKLDQIAGNEAEVVAGIIIPGTNVLAPYSGKLFRVNQQTVSETDTAFVLIPHEVAYAIEGKVPLKFKDSLHNGMKMKIIISSDKIKHEVVVYGQIREVSPVAQNNEVSFYGNIDRQSNQILKNNFLYSPTIKAISEVSVSNRTILQILFDKAN